MDKQALPDIDRQALRYIDQRRFRRPVRVKSVVQSGGRPRDVDEIIGDLAAAQHGIVARRQLLARGVTVPTVRSRVRSGRLRPIHRGVYQVGPVAGRFAREMAAVLACGPGAVVSHRSAGSLWAILPPADATMPVELTINSRRPFRRPGVVVHRTLSLDVDDLTHLEGVPITSPVRTLLDLAAVLRFRELEQALARAERAELVNRTDLSKVAERHRHRPGVSALRALLAGEAAPAMARSEAEERFLQLIRKAQLPPPETNVKVHGFEVDFLWRAQGVAVEVDGFAYHRSPASFEGDRRRDAHLAAQGIHVMRVTWRQLTTEPEAVLVRLAQTLVRGELRTTTRSPV